VGSRKKSRKGGPFYRVFRDNPARSERNPLIAQHMVLATRMHNPSPMKRHWFDPPLEQLQIIVVDRATLRRAERLVRACEACKPDDCVSLFDSALDQITGGDPQFTDYFLPALASCPWCSAPIQEKTAVVWKIDDDDAALWPSPIVPHAREPKNWQKLDLLYRFRH
jgi:hypothetical protein